MLVTAVGFAVGAEHYDNIYQYVMAFLAGAYGLAGAVILVWPAFNAYLKHARENISAIPKRDEAASVSPESGPLSPRALHKRIAAAEAAVTIPPRMIQWYVDGLWMVAASFFLQIMAATLALLYTLGVL